MTRERCDLPRRLRSGWLESLDRSAWLIGPVVVLALALAAAGWLALRGVPPVVTWLDIGSPVDDPYITGAFPPERNPAESYRWTTSEATLHVPVPSDGHYRLDLAIAAIGDAPRDLRLTCPGGDTSLTIAPGQTPPVVSLDCRVDDSVTLAISVPETRVPGDGRPLGIAIRDVRVTALDTDTIWLWRLRVGLLASAAIAGLWLTTTALTNRRVALGSVLTAAAFAVVVSLRRPEWIAPLTAGPSGIVALAAGYACWLLSGSRRTAPLALGIIALVSVVVIPQTDLNLLLPALWTPHDNDAFRLLPLLSALAVVLAALLGGRRAPLIAGAANAISLASLLAPVAIRLLLVRWSLVLDGPDWTDVASPLGAGLLGATALVTVLACVALPSSARRPHVALAIVVVFALAILVPWRNDIMDLNGDEPHYYVTAHSIAADADLELLDDYLEPDYLANTISPTGNIAVDRDTAPDRYAAFAPQPDGSHYLFPDPASGLSGLQPRDVPVATRARYTLVDNRGNRDVLPPLFPGRTLAIPLTGPCSINSLRLAAMSNESASVTVRMLDGTGDVLWQDSLPVSDAAITLHPPLDNTVCTPDFGGTIHINADNDVIAFAIDKASGLRILPAQPPNERWLLGPLPRDRYATQEATARLALYNPGTSDSSATITVLTPTQSLMRTSRAIVLPGMTVVVDLDLAGAAAVEVDADSPLAVGATGWVPGGSYALPAMVHVTDWSLTVDSASNRDAGVWLVAANTSSDVRTVTVADGDTVTTQTICANCADMVHIPAGSRERDVRLSSADGPIAVAAVAYQERTGALHFDVGLPVLSALPVRLAGTDAAPVVSAIATLLLAIGVAQLLTRIGVERRHAAVASASVALLAPLSPYAVRLYTEPLAACLIVWALVCIDHSRQRSVLAVAALALAGALPLVHGRYLPVAMVLIVLALVTGLRRASVSRRHLFALAAVVVIVGAAIVVSPLAVALRERASASYFSTEWVPHNLLGILADRGSGLIPFAPWCLLAFAVRRPLHPLQQAAVILFATQLSVVALRAGGWQTFGAPARYILPVVPLLALLAVPGAIRLWRSRSSVGRSLVATCLGWSVLATVLLHWLPLSGYVAAGHYFIDDARREIALLVPFALAPTVAPSASSNLIGLALIAAIWVATVRSVLHSRS